jgi:hypothetical protein
MWYKADATFGWFRRYCYTSCCGSSSCRCCIIILFTAAFLLVAVIFHSLFL